MCACEGNASTYLIYNCCWTKLENLQITWECVVLVVAFTDERKCIPKRRCVGTLIVRPSVTEFKGEEC
jgi:hypothetical protein